MALTCEVDARVTYFYNILFVRPRQLGRDDGRRRPVYIYIGVHFTPNKSDLSCDTLLLYLPLS